LNPDNLQHFLTEIDIKKVETLREAVSNGTYAVRPEDLAPKIMEHMLQSGILDETSITASTLHLEPKDQMKSAS
jgi:Anti-sigma-28 factor, FlgM